MTVYQKWEEKFNVGVEKFDNQHKQMLSKINEIHDEIHGSNERKTLTNLLTELITLTEKHFSDEEADLKDKDYPDLLEHIDEHRNLIIEITSLKELYRSDQLILDDEVIGFLANWLSVHTVEIDSGYTHLFK